MKKLFLSVILLVLTQQMGWAMTADKALQALKQGNDRFVSGKLVHYNYEQSRAQGVKGQHPASVILSCMDSRVPPNAVFNADIGSMFVIRNAGNVENNDVLASLEYATAVVKTPLVVVMGHSSCGAMAAACDKVELGHITQLTQSLASVVKQVEEKTGNHDCKDPVLVNDIAKANVAYQIKQIQVKSPIVADLVKAGKVKIIGAYYDLKTGKVLFLND
jgi:carbonic anhydrase